METTVIKLLEKITGKLKKRIPMRRLKVLTIYEKTVKA